MVFQELNLFGNLSVAENIFATREITRGRAASTTRSRSAQAGELMERLQTGIDPRAMVEDLRIGQQQLVEIAKAVSQNARILIMDEPTSALSAPEVEVLFRVIADLKAQGVAIVYISHRLEELIRIGDYITVLRDGRITGHEAMRNVDTHWIVRQMIGQDAKDFAKGVGHTIGDVVFKVEDVSLPRVTGGLAVDHISLRSAGGRDLGGLRAHGRRSQRIARLHHGPATARDRHDHCRRPADPEPRHDGPDRQRACADPGGPAARGAGRHHVDRREPHHGEPETLRARLPHPPCRRAPGSTGRHPRPDHQGGRPGSAGLVVVAAATSRKW